MLACACKVGNSKNMASLQEFVQDRSKINSLRRMLFAVSYLPKDMPKYWEAIKNFSKVDLSTCELQTAVQNLESLNRAAFVTDVQLMNEMYTDCIGVILISTKQKCGSCGEKLNARADRPRRLVLYTQSSGTLPATHYRKVCCRARYGCNFVQHYGFFTTGMMGGGGGGGGEGGGGLITKDGPGLLPQPMLHSLMQQVQFLKLGLSFLFNLRGCFNSACMLSFPSYKLLPASKVHPE